MIHLSCRVPEHIRCNPERAAFHEELPHGRHKVRLRCRRLKDGQGTAVLPQETLQYHIAAQFR